MKNVENILKFNNYTLQNISDEDGDDIIAFRVII